MVLCSESDARNGLMYSSRLFEGALLCSWASQGHDAIGAHVPCSNVWQVTRVLLGCSVH